MIHNNFLLKKNFTKRVFNVSLINCTHFLSFYLIAGTVILTSQNYITFLQHYETLFVYLLEFLTYVRLLKFRHLMKLRIVSLIKK